MQSLVSYEQRERLSSSFPIEYHYVDSLHPRYKMPFHWHMDFELITVHQGQLTLLLDGEETELRPGLFAFIPGGVIHGGFPRGKNTVYECIVLNLDDFLYNSPIEQGQFRGLMNSGSNIRRCFSRDSSSGYILEHLFNEVRSGEAGYHFFTTGLLWQFIGSVFRENQYDSIPGATQHGTQRAQQIKKVLDRIRKDYQTHLTLDDLSAEAAMSPKYFCRVFRHITGHTPIDYLNYYRVERAAEMIYATNENITDIGLHCGFNELSYFSRMFRKYKGLSPQEYRKKVRI